MNSVSQKDIADYLKLSRATVTKALQNHPDIAEATREKVQKYARELGYLPNLVGRSLSTKRTYTIGVVVPKIAHSFFSTAIEYMYEEAAKHGYQLMLMVSFEDAKNEAANIETLLSMRVDGLIIDSAATETDPKMYELIKKRGTPFVFFDRKPTGSTFPGIFFDDYEGAYAATSFLISRGYKKIGIMSGAAQLSICHDRIAGFKAAMQDQNLELNPLWQVGSKLTEEDGYLQFKKFVEHATGMPEAIVCINDSIAHGVYRAATELSMRIPEDLGVVGFGDLALSGFLSPPLTTVKLPVASICKTAINTMVRLITEDYEIKEDQRFEGELIIRGSTK